MSKLLCSFTQSIECGFQNEVDETISKRVLDEIYAHDIEISNRIDKCLRGIDGVDQNELPVDAIRLIHTRLLFQTWFAFLLFVALIVVLEKLYNVVPRKARYGKDDNLFVKTAIMKRIERNSLKVRGSQRR